VVSWFIDDDDVAATRGLPARGAATSQPART